jgi:hypothetical protein
VGVRVRMRVMVSVVVRVRAKMIVSVWGEGEDGLSLKWVDENENWRKLDYYIYNTGRKSCSSLYNITFFFLILIDDLSTFLFSTFFFRPFSFDLFTFGLFTFGLIPVNPMNDFKILLPPDSKRTTNVVFSEMLLFV